LNRPDQRLAGVLWLDEKMSEEPYSARDKDLLQMIAGQIAVVHENLRLKEQLADEQRVRINVLSHLDERSVNLLKECPSCGRCYDRSAELCAVDGIELTTLIPVERVVEKKYRLDRRLGSGGMGGVYEATDLRLNRTVALKVMVGRLFGNRVALRRFEREARTSARLRHPNIVTIHDFGRLQGEGAYLVVLLLFLMLGNLRAGLIAAVAIPLSIMRQGYRVVFEPNARAFDGASETAKQEFVRKTRTIAGMFQLISREGWLLNPLNNRLWFETVSHKVLRLALPLLHVAVLAANIALADAGLYGLALAAQAGFYAAGAVGLSRRSTGRRLIVFTAPSAMCVLLWATVVGFYRFVTNRQRVTWERVTVPAPATRRDVAA